MKPIKIGNKTIGDGNPCCFMAEIGGNYKDFNEAKILIDSAKRAGVDVIKFQTFEADTMTTKNNGNQYRFFKKIEPGKLVQRLLHEHSIDQGLISITAPSHMKDLDFIDSLNPPAYKIGSDLACHIPLLKKIARIGKPIILSTGMCGIGEINASIKAIKKEGNENIILLHCISNYPAKIEETNLKVIPLLKRMFDLPVGFSDHSIGSEMSIAAIALGANMIERHFCNEHTQHGSDYIISSGELGYQHIISIARKLEIALSKGMIKEPSKTELENLKTNRVSIIAMKDISKGTMISGDMIDIRRPGTGLAPSIFDALIGNKVIKDIKKETPLQWEMFQ